MIELSIRDVASMLAICGALAGVIGSWFVMRSNISRIERLLVGSGGFNEGLIGAVRTIDSEMKLLKQKQETHYGLIKSIERKYGDSKQN